MWWHVHLPDFNDSSSGSRIKTVQRVNPAFPVGTALEIRLRYYSSAAPITAMLGTPNKGAEVALIVLESEPIVTFTDCASCLP